MIVLLLTGFGLVLCPEWMFRMYTWIGAVTTLFCVVVLALVILLG